MPIEVMVTLGLAAVGYIVWLIRLEGRVNMAERETQAVDKRVDTLEIKHENLDSKIVGELTLLREGMARIEGYLQRAKEE